MSRRVIATVLALLILCPTIGVAADGPTATSPKQSGTQSGATDNVARRKSGWTLVALGVGGSIHGLGHQVMMDPSRPYKGTTQDGRVVVSGFAVATVGAMLLWKSPLQSHASPVIETNPGRQSAPTPEHWRFHP